MKWIQHPKENIDVLQLLYNMINTDNKNLDFSLHKNSISKTLDQNLINIKAKC